MIENMNSKPSKKDITIVARQEGSDLEVGSNVSHEPSEEITNYMDNSSHSSTNGAPEIGSKETRNVLRACLVVITILIVVAALSQLVSS